MHRYIVDEHHWISDAQFTSSIAIAQAAPGPNVLFVATLGWSVAGPIGAIATMFGTLLPSTLLTLAVTRWGAKRKETRGVRAFTTGMTPLTIGLLVATGWLLAAPYATDRAPCDRRDRAGGDQRAGHGPHQAQPDVAGGPGRGRRRARLGLSACR